MIELRDNKNYPIRENDIIKVPHFKSRNRNHFMYKIVSFENGQWYAYCVAELFTKGKTRAHKCRVQYIVENGGCEIIDGYDQESPNHLPTFWYSRKKKPKEVA